jgi:uncharacterized protein (DUF1499 family)
MYCLETGTEVVCIGRAPVIRCHRSHSGRLDRSISSIGDVELFGVKPGNLGVKNGRLAPCPDTPNCVSSQTEEPRSAVAAIPFTGSAEMAMARLCCALRECPRTKIITARDQYIHAESRSRVFRFVDDLELSVDRTESVIHLRSASRVGYSDFGVNRKRVEGIRLAFERLARSEGDLTADAQ